MTGAHGDVSESPRKRRKQSSERAQEFLETAKLLDTCSAGQKLLFLEHSWTVARALKVISMPESSPGDRGCVRAVHPATIDMHTVRLLQNMSSGTGRASHFQRSAVYQTRSGGCGSRRGGKPSANFLGMG